VVGFDSTTEAALKVLTVQINRLQRHLEFDFYSYDHNDTFIQHLLPGCTVDLSSDSAIRAEIPDFVTRHTKYLMRLQEEPPEWFVLITVARDEGNYYSRRKAPVSVLLLGNWSAACAPPSVVEFLLTALVREGAAALSPRQRESVHFGEKGCLFDYSFRLSDARLKAVNSFVCQFCRARLALDGHATFADDIERVLDKSWLGKSSDPATPAGIVANMGYDLFLNKGLKPTKRERLVSSLQDEGVKALYAIIVAVLIAALLLAFGLKASGI